MRTPPDGLQRRPLQPRRARRLGPLQPPEIAECANDRHAGRGQGCVHLLNMPRAPAKSDESAARPTRPMNPRAIIAGVIFVIIVDLAFWSLARPEPWLVQVEVESTRIDIAARVSGRLAKVAV